MTTPTNVITSKQFLSLRRQKYLTLEYYNLNIKYHERIIDEIFIAIKNKTSDNYNSSMEYSVFEHSLLWLMLHYTAGRAVEELIQHLHNVIGFLSMWQNAYVEEIRALERKTGEKMNDAPTPLYFEDLELFQKVLDVSSLAFLFGEGAAIRKLVYWLRGYRHQDMLFEEIVSPAISDPDFDCEEFFHVIPYQTLIEAFVCDSQKDASALIFKYLKSWYKSFEGTSWHNGHLLQFEENPHIMDIGPLSLLQLQFYTISKILSSEIILYTPRTWLTGHVRITALKRCEKN